MKIAVLGAGVIGVTTAQALSALGHEVVVVDRQPKVAEETSFANGGQVSATHAAPWAAPHMPLQAFKWMFQADAPLLFKPLRWDPALWRWGLRFLANCTTARTAVNGPRRSPATPCPAVRSQHRRNPLPLPRRSLGGQRP
jgi:D-amino-acid dehydrogenase